MNGPAPPERSPGAERPAIDRVRLPGRTSYRPALELQRRLARDRIEARSDRDLLLLVEHDPVLTLGRGTDPGHLVADRAELERRGVELVEIERGGDVTYHGPGQLVGYPVLDLRDYRQDLHWYLRAVEEALIRALGELGLPAFRVPEHTGVWVGDERALGDDDGDDTGRGAAGGGPGAGDEDPRPGVRTDPVDAAVAGGRVRKIASIGIHVSRWVTWHGFALNVDDRALENFGLIVPCGIEGVTMTTLAREGVGAGPERLEAAVGRGFAAAFDARVRPADPADLGIELPADDDPSAAGDAGGGPGPDAARRADPGPADDAPVSPAEARP